MNLLIIIKKNIMKKVMYLYINKIYGCLAIEFEKYFDDKIDCNEPTAEGYITRLQCIYKNLLQKFNSKNEDDIPNKKKENYEGENSESSSLEIEDNDEENKESTKENENKSLMDFDNIPFRILLILNNIGSSIGQSKNFQYNLSDLAFQLDFIRLFVTCENLVIPFYWTSEVKNNYRFCFLKYDTFEPYEHEIDENNSIKIGTNIREGFGLKEIFCSFSETQKKLMKEIAKLNLKGDHDHLTQKGLVNYFVETGIGLVTDIQKLEALMGEAIDHEIVELKVSSENNKEIYKMNLERSIIERIAEGEFM